MPVIRVGPWCPRCRKHPAIDGGECHRCRLLGRLTGRAPIPPAPVTRFDAMVQAGEAHPALSREFEREMRAWLERETA